MNSPDAGLTTHNPRKAKSWLLAITSLLLALALLCLCGSLLPAEVINDVSRESLRDFGVTFLAGAGGAGLAFINFLSNVIQLEFEKSKKIELVAIDLEQSANQIRQRLDLEQKYAREKARSDLEQSAVIEFREIYIARIFPTLKMYSEHVTQLGMDELFHQFDQMLELRQELLKSVSRLRGRLLDENDPGDKLLTELQTCCQRLLLDTRFPGTLVPERKGFYEAAIAEARRAYFELDAQLRSWMIQKMQSDPRRPH